MINNTPYIKVKVNNRAIKGKDGYTDAYIIAITTLPNRPHLFTVHTVDGAVYSRLPVWAFKHFQHKLNPSAERILFKTRKKLDEYGVISEQCQIIQLEYLKDYEAEILTLSGTKARYIFSIEPVKGQFAEDPEQSKLLHFLELETGHYGIFPNNHLKFLDNYFTEPSSDAYIRTTEYYTL